MENLCSTVQSLMSPAQKTKSHWPTAPTDTLGRTPCNHLLEQKDKRKSSRLSTHISHIPKIFVGHCEKARAGEMIAKNATYGVEKRIALGGQPQRAHKHHQKVYSACVESDSMAAKSVCFMTHAALLEMFSRILEWRAPCGETLSIALWHRSVRKILKFC